MASLPAGTLTRTSSCALGQQPQQGRESGELLGGQLTQLHPVAGQHCCQSLQSCICWGPDTELRAAGKMNLGHSDARVGGRRGLEH